MFTAAAINSFRSLETLYKEGDHFSGDSGYSIIKVVAIEEQNIVDEKLKEAEKLGFKRAIVPKANMPRNPKEFPNLEIFGIGSLQEAVDICRNAAE